MSALAETISSGVPKGISIVPKPLPITTTKEQPKLPPQIPQFREQKHPLRFAIQGKQHLIAPLKDLISADTNIPDHYKAMLHAELDSLKSNAAQVSLHITDNADDSISISAHIKPIQLG